LRAKDPRGAVQVVLGDATALPFATASFAAAVACHVLHLVADWVAAVDELLKQELLLGRTEGHGKEGGAAPRLEETLLRPALNVRGLQSGNVGERAQNAIPEQARLSIDFRLVPDQTPAKVRERFEAYLASLGYTVVHDTPGPEARLAHPRLVKLAWGAERVLELLRKAQALCDEGRGETVMSVPCHHGSSIRSTARSFVSYDGPETQGSYKHVPEIECPLLILAGGEADKITAFGFRPDRRALPPGQVQQPH
jgi:hypothetical protein